MVRKLEKACVYILHSWSIPHSLDPLIASPHCSRDFFKMLVSSDHLPKDANISVLLVNNLSLLNGTGPTHTGPWPPLILILCPSPLDLLILLSLHLPPFSFLNVSHALLHQALTYTRTSNLLPSRVPAYFRCSFRLQSKHLFFTERLPDSSK